MLALPCLLPISTTAQTTLYWDTNSTTAGAGGTTPTGTWKTSGGANKNWNTVEAGTGTTANWTNDSIAVFSAGNGATGSFTVTVSSAPTVDSIFVEEGDITFNSSSLTLTGATPTVDIASGATATFNTKFLGSNGLVKDGTGTLVLNSSGNAYTGDTVINAGTVQLGSNATILPSTTAVILANGASLNFTASGVTQQIGSLAGAGSLDLADNLLKVGGDDTNTTFSGSLSGSGDLRKEGTGALTLAGDNSGYSGVLDLNTGIVIAASDNALGTATSGNDIATGAALQFSGGASVTETDLTIRGTGTDGTGVLRSLDGNNTLTAAVTLSTAATIAADSGSTLTLDGDVSQAGRNLTVTGAGDVVIDGVLSGTGAGQLIKDGAGTLTLSGTSANTNAGAITVNDGVIELGKTAGTDATGGGEITIGDNTGAAGSATVRLLADNQLPDDSGLLTLNSDGALDLNGFTETIDRIAGNGLIDFGSDGTLTLGAADGDSTFSGDFAGTGTLIKTGTGSLAFDSDLTFDGTIELGGGLLRLSSMTLDLDALTVTANSTLDFAGTASVLTLANLTISDGVTLTITNWANATDYFFTTNWTGAVLNTKGLAPMNQIVFNGYTGNDTSWLGYDKQVTPVPEPSTYGAALLSLVSLLVCWRRRRS